jgi:putative ABC transport system permease protein
MSALTNDVRYGVRMLLQNPASTLVALVALSLGIGANSAIFSVVNGVLLRPLPYQDPDRLMVVWETKLSIGKTQELVSPMQFRGWASENRVFDRMAALRQEPRVLTGGELPERVETVLISPSGFEMLGVKPALGRTFSPDENQPGRNLAAILSYGLWQRRFGGDRGVLGKTVILDGIGYTVVGVTPPDFRLLDVPSELWIPYALDSKELNPRNRAARTLRVIARLKPGATLLQAQAEMRSIARRLELADPDANTGYSASVIPLRDQLVGDIRTTLWMLLGAVLFVLLIACANVANLLLARAGAREREISLRAALGANPARLLRQLLTESVLLSLAGGLLGLVLAAWSISLLKQLGPATLPRLKEIGVDWRVLGFTLLISAATGIIFGLAPALASLRTDLNSVLRSAGRLSSAGGPAAARFRDALVIAEMAACVVLLTGAGLLIRSFARLESVNPGFQPDHVLTMQIELPESRYSDFNIGLFYKRLLERLQVLPGVRFAAIARKAPLSGGDDTSLNFIIENRPLIERSADQNRAQYRAVSADYFDALRIPLIRGRHFDRTDGANTPGVVVINETLARTFFGGEDALGKRIQSGLDDSAWCTIIGVVRDVKHQGLDAQDKPETYYHYLQVPPPVMGFVEGAMTVVLRTVPEPDSLAAAARGEVRKMDPSLAVYDVHSMESLLDSSLAQPRFRTTLLGVFAGLALLLAAVGLYGVIAYSVARRTNELGVRMAMGAQRNDVLKLVLGQGAKLAIFGIAIGLGVAFGAMRVISKLLFGVNAADPLTFAVTALLILAVAFGSSLIPAWRAIKVDPVVALRYE